MLGMIGCDFLSNTIQLAFMGHSELRAVSYSALIAVFRGVLVWILYWLYEWEHLYLRKREHQRHYAQLNQIVTDIYAESFYLQKSMEDLNVLTRKSHQLYEDLEGQADLAGRALDIAREAHEIRKDYQRVVQGISALVSEHAHSKMRMADIFRIIEENTRRQIGERNAQIRLDMECGTDLSVRQYYDLFAVLNNLIVNSLDACGQRGQVTVKAAAAGGMLELSVADDGCGIDEDMKEYIWGPGFSTKYDEKTGEMSTGIGLCHVENVVRHLNGTVDVASSPGRGTRFSVRIPLARLQGQER